MCMFVSSRPSAGAGNIATSRRSAQESPTALRAIRAADRLPAMLVMRCVRLPDIRRTSSQSGLHRSRLLLALQQRQLVGDLGPRLHAFDITGALQFGNSLFHNTGRSFAIPSPAGARINGGRVIKVGIHEDTLRGEVSR